MDADTVRKQFASGAQFASRAAVNAALKQLGALDKQHPLSIADDNRSGTSRSINVVCSPHTSRCLYVRLTQTLSPPNSAWIVGTSRLHAAGHIGSAKRSLAESSSPAKRRRTASGRFSHRKEVEGDDSEDEDNDEADQLAGELKVGMLILGRKFDWDPWPGQITFIAPESADGEELDLPSTRASDTPTMPSATIAVRWFCTEEEPDWLEPDRIVPLSLEQALKPPARKASRFDAADYKNLLGAFEEAAKLLKRQAKRPARRDPAPIPPMTSPSPAHASQAAAPSSTAPVPPSPPVRLDGTIGELLDSIDPRMGRAADALVEAGVEDVGTLLRLRETELRDLLGLVAGIVPLHRILLLSRLRPFLAQS